MEFGGFVISALIFTVFGYLWGRTGSVATPSRETIERIVSNTMDNLEKGRYLRSEMINGELHYIKWPIERDEKDR